MEMASSVALLTLDGHLCRSEGGRKYALPIMQGYCLVLAVNVRLPVSTGLRD